MSLSLRHISLGGVSLGSLPLGKGGGASVAVPKDLYKRILNSMPSTLRESLVAWYSPNLQGLTNAELADSLNEYVDGLKDLSGNGNHMTLYNFSGVGPESDENGNGGGYVNADGDLGFDGVDDEAVGTIPDVAVVVTADGQTAVAAVDSEDITLGVNDSGSHIVMTLVERIYFDRELNDEELSWVLKNMTGENAHVTHKTNTITLYCGEFDDDGTLIDDSYDVFTFSVQHGNSLNDADGNLLSKYHKDIDATHCTSDTWYDTDGLPYAGEAITEDATFYCERMLIYEHMLEQLDALTLSDGSTAKEHLVCWYQPKLQGLTKESVLADKVLADLSGNNHDMTLDGFTEDEDIINSDGALMFDGVDDHAYNVGNNIDLSEFTFIGKTYRYELTTSPETRWCPSFVLYNNARNPILKTSSPMTDVKTEYSLWGQTNSFACSPIGDVEECITTSAYSLNSTTITPITTGSIKVANQLRIAYTYINNRYAHVDVKMFILFDLTLTTDDLTKVKQILKLS